VTRCFGDGDALYEEYHDTEWGRPVRTEQGLFERLCLEGTQAGLSWRLILGRRPQLREAFAGFDPDLLAGWSDARLEATIDTPGVIRSMAKIRMARTNAQATVRLRERGGLVDLIWGFQPPPRQVRRRPGDPFVAQTPESVAMSKTLKKAGFTFVGPVTAYALMQAVGLVDDHLPSCPV
jgi:DNA-3-methyladenine glycosylase I